MDVNSNHRRGQGLASPLLTLAGFTLVELITVLAIGAALLAVAAPSFSSFSDSITMRSEVNTLLNAMHLARAEAIKSNGVAMLCKSPDGADCSDDVDWDAGWMLFHDANNNRTYDSNEEIVRRYEATETDIDYSVFPYYTRHYVAFHPDGRTRSNGTFVFCDGRGASEAKALIIYRTGRIRSSDSASDGSDLECS